MIITRTPFRISFAGGGSDLPVFHDEEPGAVLSTAINKYMFLAVKPLFGESFRISYSRTELVNTVAEIQHPIVRECLTMLDVKPGLEIVSMADLPARSGIGSSSSFTVGLLHALYAMRGQVVSPERLAAEACAIEIERLGDPIGKQDQYIAAYGGLQFIQFQPDGSVFVDPVVCAAETRHDLNQRLLMFFTGMTRTAVEVLIRQQANTNDRRDHVRALCRIAREMRDILSLGRDLNAFGRLLDEAWREKKKIEETISNPCIDAYYERGLAAGALGGKLLGAGGGGFLLFYCEPQRQEDLRRAMGELTEVPFRFDPQGSKLVYIGNDY